jgi:single-strand DNA-binding protein
MLKTNYVQIIGNVGQDIELKSSDGGHSYCHFSVATNHNFVNKQGQKVTQTHWHRCTAFGKQAEILAKYLKKGSSGVFQGSLIPDSYEDQNKVTHYTSNIRIDEVFFFPAAK